VHFCASSSTRQWSKRSKKGAGLAIGVDHPRYSATLEAPSAVRDSLAGIWRDLLEQDEVISVDQFRHVDIASMASISLDARRQCAGIPARCS